MSESILEKAHRLVGPRSAVERSEWRRKGWKVPSANDRLARNVSSTPNLVAYHVKGDHDEYLTVISLGDFICSCPATGICSHVLAVMLAEGDERLPRALALADAGDERALAWESAAGALKHLFEIVESEDTHEGEGGEQEPRTTLLEALDRFDDAHNIDKARREELSA